MVAHDAGQKTGHVRVDHQLVMVSAKALRDDAREGQLVHLGAHEANREGLHGTAGRARHTRHHDGGIEAAREKRAQGHV